jgi:hypothetical protein
MGQGTRARARANSPAPCVCAAPDRRPATIALGAGVTVHAPRSGALSTLWCVLLVGSRGLLLMLTGNAARACELCNLTTTVVSGRPLR